MQFRLVILLIASLSLLAGLCRSAQAKDDPRHVQIQAAQADALASLMDQVRTARLAPDLTVADFLQRTGGEDRLRRAVARNVEVIGATMPTRSIRRAA